MKGVSTDADDKAPVYPIVRVLWTDHHSSDGWEPVDDLHFKIPTETTVGFLVDETDVKVTIAATVGGTQCNSRAYILKGCIDRVEYLRSGLWHEEVN